MDLRRLYRVQWSGRNEINHKRISRICRFIANSVELISQQVKGIYTILLGVVMFRSFYIGIDGGWGLCFAYHISSV